jgi:hypothetical protein
MAPDYVMPLQEKLSKTHCIQCGKMLHETAKPFPDTYLGEDGKIYTFVLRATPNERNSMFKEFWDLYS